MSQNLSVRIASIYKSRKNVLEIMDKQQGYNVEDYDNFSVNEIYAMNANNQLDMLIKKKDNENIKMYIRYVNDRLNINEIIDDLFNVEQILTKEDTLFIIAKDDMNETTMKELIHIWERDKIFVVVQSIERLRYNILNHDLQPKFRVLTDTEKEEVKKQYNIANDKQFPEISRFDAAAQLIGIRPGQVCEILRPSKTAIHSKYYRICV
jgi:DNA-directed RNA polymerase subunit H (RpoH/RPB5)